MPFRLPRLYVIADADVLAQQNVTLDDFARNLRFAGVTLVQLRDKHGLGLDIAVLRDEVWNATILLNDRAEKVGQLGVDGVHLGQSDTAIEEARSLLGPEAILGHSTHTDAQVLAAHETSADYVAIGPVFATSTKTDAAPVVGLDGVRRARALTTKPLVAIGGITRQNCRSVIDAGADSVAVISALFSPNETVEEVARDFLRILR